MTTKPNTVDEYISCFPAPTQKVLQKIRATIKKAIPGSEEKISYAIPAFTLNKAYVIYFAGYKNHVSIYPAPRGAEEFKDELTSYKGGKGTVQFPLDKPIPYDLITRMVKYRLHQSKERLAKKK